MKKITIAVTATLTLAAAFTACRKITDDSALQHPTTHMPKLHTMMKPYVRTVLGQRITGINQEPEGTWHLGSGPSSPSGPYWTWDGPGCCHGTGQCLTRVDVRWVQDVPANPDDTNAIQKHDYSAPSAEFIGGGLWESGDSSMFIFKYNESNANQYFVNPAAIVMGNIPLEHPDGKYIIKAATRTGRILDLSNGRYLEIFLTKDDFQDAAW